MTSPHGFGSPGSLQGPTRVVAPAVNRVRADNPGPMTLDGTNTYVLGDPAVGSVLVVDPGPDDDDHLARIVELCGPGGRHVEAVLLTHRHADHAEGAARFAAIVGAPVRAALASLCSPGAAPLVDGELISFGAGSTLRVVATPGHTSDSVCLVLAGTGTDTEAEQFVLTGDTVLGEGSTVLMERDGGDLGDYLASLDRIEGLAGAKAHVGRARLLGLPGHGPVVSDLVERVREYRQHRLARLAEVRSALDALGSAAPGRPIDRELVAAVVARVYSEVPEHLRPAAEQSVRVQLAYLLAD